jgi:hypothetical protein
MATGAISPVLITEAPTISFAADKFGCIKVNYHNWQESKVILRGQVMQIRWSDQGVEARIIPDDLLMAAVQRSMLAVDAMTARLDTMAEEMAAMRKLLERAPGWGPAPAVMAAGSQRAPA